MVIVKHKVTFILTRFWDLRVKSLLIISLHTRHYENKILKSFITFCCVSGLILIFYLTNLGKSFTVRQVRPRLIRCYFTNTHAVICVLKVSGVINVWRLNVLKNAPLLCLFLQFSQIVCIGDSYFWPEGHWWRVHKSLRFFCSPLDPLSLILCSSITGCFRTLCNTSSFLAVHVLSHVLAFQKLPSDSHHPLPSLFQ